MEAQGCTVMVSGLPRDMDEDRLVDKLCIHFLRSRHGGGEITSVNIIKTTPGSALITFEDSKVAQSVVQYGKHILSVDGKEYKLTVNFPNKEIDQDKVFICMTVTVDYNWLPLGKESVTSVQQSSPEVQCGFDLLAGLCTLSGRYSVVQAMVTQLLGFLEKPAIARQVSGPDLASLVQVSHETRPRYHTLEGGSGTGGRMGVRVDPVLEEYNHSLIVDIDTFRYLQTYCGEEYERILSRHGAEALDVTKGGVTTLFLQARQGQRLREGGLWQAHRDLSRLCQETESRLCREQLLKESGPREGLQQALEALQLQLPRLLLGEDHKHITIVGSSSDVMEAKRFLLDLRVDEEARPRPWLGGAGLSPASDASRPDASTGKMLTTCVGGSPEGGKGYRLAARFRDTQSRVHGQNKLGTDLGMLTPSNAFKELSFMRKQRSDFNAVLGSGLFLSGQISGNERPGLSVDELNLKDQRKSCPAGEDIHLEKLDPLYADCLEGRALLSSSLIGSGLSKEKQVRSSSSAAQYMDLFGDRRVQTAPVPHSESGFKTTLRRTNSFSGCGRSKREQKAGDAAAEKLSRGNASTPGITKQEKEVYSAEVQASTVMWEYMKEAYCARLEDIISGSQMKESESDSGVTTIILSGVDSSRVDGSQKELKNMVTMVDTDFVMQELPLARLGVADPQDETLEICCAEVRSRFRKVKIQKGKESLVVIGPRQLCAQVVGALEEVFHDGAQRRKGQGEIPLRVGPTLGDTPTTMTRNKKKPRSPQSDDLDQSSSLVPADGSQEEPATQRGEETRPSIAERSQIGQKVSRGREQQVSPIATQKEPIIMTKQSKGRLKDGKQSRANAALFTHLALASTRKAVLTASTGSASQSGPGNPHSEGKGQRGRSPQRQGISQDQD